MSTTTLLDRYALLEELGRGGMGVVYRGQDLLLERTVAVKTILPGPLADEAAEQLHREARLAARMDHPSIVPIYDFGSHQGSLFIVMPLVRGQSLRTLIQERRLSLDDTLEIIVQTALALDYSHGQGVVHRDIKPENILISRQGDQLRVRVMDFGLAWNMGRGSSGPAALLGTAAYLSPEQARGYADVREGGTAILDGRTDIYALGTVLYECLVGRTPFSGELPALVERIASEPPPPLRSHGLEVDGDLEEIVLSCLAKDPEHRPARGRDLAAALLRCRTRLRLLPVLPETAGGAPGQLPLVGRGAVLAELQRRLESALTGQCQLVLVGGDAGIGKSRLLLELERLAGGRGLLVLSGRFGHGGAAVPYRGLCEWLLSFFEARAHAPASSEADPGLADLAPELLALFPLLADVEELRQAAAGSPPVVVRRDPTYAGELFARCLLRLGGGRPLVLLLDNLHGGGPAIAAFEYVVNRLAATPALIVATYRPAELFEGHPLLALIAALGQEPRCVQVQLRPLEPEAFRRLIAFQLDSFELRDDLVERLFQATGGNPYFARELLAALVQSSALTRGDDGRWALAQPETEESPLPMTIQQVVGRRLQRLSPARREVLRAASVLGHRFERRQLERLLEGDQAADELDSLVRMGLLEPDGGSGGEQLRFSSSILRDLVYRRLPRSRRRAWHGRYAHLLEERHAGQLERVYAQLLHHFAAAEVTDKTLAYAVLAARASLARFDAEGAARAAAQGLALLAGSRSDPAGMLAEGELRHVLAAAEGLQGQPEQALEQAEQAAAAFERAAAPARAARVALLAAETAWRGRRVELARRWVDRGIPLARDAALPDVLQRLLTLGVTVANLRAEYARAREYLAEAQQPPPAEAAALPAEEPMPEGGTLVVGLRGPLQSLDPAICETEEEAEVVANLFDTLLASDAEGHLVPALCASWQGSPDGTRFELELRLGLRFGDGAPLTAASVKASLERLARLKAGRLPAALSAIAGVSAFLSRQATEIWGIRVDPELGAGGGEQLSFELTEPLPIFPALLTDLHTVVVRASEHGGLVGTGAFRLIAAGADGRVVLEHRPDSWRRPVPALERVELRSGLGAAGIAEGLRSGELDLGRDLLPEDLEALSQDSRFRSGLVEVTRKNTYFVLCNLHGPTTRKPVLRQVLIQAVRIHQLVWRTLGRFAQPAMTLIPPGVLGHDPGRRRASLTPVEAVECLRSAGLEPPLRLYAAVHPIFQDRYGALLDALAESWAVLGIDLDLRTTSQESYLRACADSSGLDLLISRWIPDYEDPSTFTTDLFHRQWGFHRSYFSSQQGDHLLQQARQERDPQRREQLYREFEQLLDQAGVLLPLLHDVDYRIAQPAVRGLHLNPMLPPVQYARLGKALAPVSHRDSAPRRVDRGEIHVPSPHRIDALDPVGGQFFEHYELLANVFETLTRVEEDARVVPWLAASWSTDPGGRTYRFELRPGVRFHDGRRLTARDVRYSFERVLRTPHPGLHTLLLPIRGAQQVCSGATAFLAGFRILSTTSFELELEGPVAFFPAMLAHPGVAVVPEGSEDLYGSWRDGCSGTGPFRVLGLQPRSRLDLERNPRYWRPEFPRTDRLTFHLGLPPEQIFQAFRAGQMSLACDLLPEDVEALRRDPEFAPCYRESPRLATYFLALNVHRGPFADLGLRRALVQALDVEALLRETAGRAVSRASGILPPGLAGYELPRPSAPPAQIRAVAELAGLHLRAAVLPVLAGPYARFWRHLSRDLRDLRLVLEPFPGTTLQVHRMTREGSVDVAMFRWVADYPDADAFAFALFHSAQGVLRGMCADAEIDRLCEQGRQEVDPALRHACYRQLEDLLRRDARIVPLFHEPSYRFCHPRLRGLRFGMTLPEVRYEELYLAS